MFRASAFIGFLVSTGLICPAGCSEAVDSSAVAKDCFANVSGSPLFIGSKECMLTLPPQRMSGVWIVGLEYSVFYEGKTEIVSKEKESRVWLMADATEVLSPRGYSFDGKTARYYIDFIGRKSDSPGMYGHFGEYERGVLLEQIIVLKPIRQK